MTDRPLRGRELDRTRFAAHLPRSEHLDIDDDGIYAKDVTVGWYQLQRDRSFFKVEFIQPLKESPGYLQFRLMTEVRNRPYRYLVIFSREDRLAWDRDEDEVPI